MSKASPFTVSVPEEKLAAIRTRIETYPWFPAPANEQGFAYGMSTPVLQDLCAYWLNEFDWRAQEAWLNEALPGRRTRVRGLDLHFVNLPSGRRDALPRPIHDRPWR